MDEIKKALLGDKEAQKAVTERGELLPCPFCGSKNVIISIIRYSYNTSPLRKTIWKPPSWKAFQNLNSFFLCHSIFHIIKV